MKLESHQRVDYATARDRVIARLKLLHPGRLLSAYRAADVIWPGHNMKSIAAVGGASSILKRMRDENLVEQVWDVDTHRSDWRLR